MTKQKRTFMFIPREEKDKGRGALRHVCGPKY